MKSDAPWQILFCVDHTGSPVADDALTPLQLRLARLGIETRRPLVRKIKRVGLLRVRVPYDLPKYPGYIFARADPQTRQTIENERPKGVVGWVLANGRFASVPDAEVSSIMATREGDQQPIETLFEVGTVVQYKSGPLSDLELVVTKADEAEVTVDTPLMSGHTAKVHPRDLRRA